jgi:hypothetical protein
LVHARRPCIATGIFRDTRAARRAVEGLLDESLISHDDADRFRAEHPDPDVP